MCVCCPGARRAPRAWHRENAFAVAECEQRSAEGAMARLKIGYIHFSEAVASTRSAVSKAARLAREAGGQIMARKGGRCGG